jgi:hypothetical protein
MKKMLRGIVVLLLAQGLAGCGGSGSSPTPLAPTVVPPVTSGPTAAPAPSLTSVTVAGNVAFTAVGQTSQLVATAVFSDATTRDVTSVAKWTSGNLSVATILPSGVLTVVGLGGTFISVLYQTKYGNVRVNATPPDTFTLSGRVREPGNSGIAGARVAETQFGQSTVTDAYGDFSLARLTNLRVAFEKDGFEPVQLDVKPNSAIDVPMQRIIRLAAGETVTPLRLAPHDMSYDVGGALCFSCRLIRIVAPVAGTLHLKLTWIEPKSTLNLWAGRMFVGTYPAGVVADVSVGAGETVLYIGMLLPPGAEQADQYTPFTLATALQN